MITRSSRRKRPQKPLTRSEVMSRVRSKDTGPEMVVRRAFWAAGLRYRLHDKRLPGKPDLVFPSRRLVVFVHGCFWHGHSGCPRHRIPKTRTDWWAGKIRRNQERDEAARAALEASGWTVLIGWECEVERDEDLAKLIARVVAAHITGRP